MTDDRQEGNEQCISRRQCLGAAAAAVAASAAPARISVGEADVRSGFKIIDSIAELRQAMRRSNQKIRMKPGAYPVDTTLEDDDTLVFRVTGSNNHFDMRGVRVQIDTRMLNDMPNAGAHALGVYEITGHGNIFEGAVFENVGNKAPRRSLSDFEVRGDENVFRRCRFLVQGSSPYGYGDMYGKGGGSAVPTRKHSCMSVNGDRTRIENCYFRIQSFGHGIHLHGAEETVIRNIQMKGVMRRGRDIYGEEEGPAARFDYKKKFPPWEEGEPIPKDEMICLTEDGIRAYSGSTKETTVENCTVRKMRGGIALVQDRNTRVRNCTVLDCSHGYGIPTGAVVRNCRGNAAYGPLLQIPYNNRSSADIELDLLPAEHELGNHPLANIVGSDHRVRIRHLGDPPAARRRILVGWTWGRLGDGRWADGGADHHAARDIRLENLTPQPVVLTRFASGCRVTSRGPVDDRGKDNKVM